MLNNIVRFFPSIVVSLLVILLCMGVLDFIWFGVIAGKWYSAQMGSLMRETFVVWPWGVFYLMYGGVVFVLAVVANRDKPFYYAGIDGALLGIASYGAYNLTNYSILNGFPLSIALIDWGWGTFLTSTSAIVGWLGFQRMRT